jgi:hypothetical protein
MTGMRSSGPGARNRRRIGRTRENGMRSVSRITSLAVAVSLALSAVVSAIAAFGFAGRANATTGGSSATSAANGSSTGIRLALPPKGDGGALSAPAAPPVSQPVGQAPPPVTSGGS